MKKTKEKNPPPIKKNKPTKKQVENKRDDDSISFNLPEIEDIPGQEHIRPPRMREMMDTTASSADEEGEGLLDDINKKDIASDRATSAKSNVSNQEKKLLRNADSPVSEEEKDRLKLSLNSTDGEDKLNESADVRDLGEDLDDTNEIDEENKNIGEEDEENDIYSRPD